MPTPSNPYEEQIMRCSALNKFPLHPQGIKELRDTLRGIAGTTERARKIIDRVMQSNDACPTPHELKAVAAEVRRQEDLAPTGCPICNGEPWVTVEREVIDALSKLPMKRLGSARCTCSKGQWFRMKDRENQIKREQGLPV